MASQERLCIVEFCILVILKFEPLTFVNTEVRQVEATVNWFELNTAV